MVLVALMMLVMLMPFVAVAMGLMLIVMVVMMVFVYHSVSQFSAAKIHGPACNRVAKSGRLFVLRPQEMLVIR